jgi:hypothetical protein
MGVLGAVYLINPSSTTNKITYYDDKKYANTNKLHPDQSTQKASPYISEGR